MTEQIEVGSIYEGKVVRIKPFGAIISLPGNVQGLLHISHISSNYVHNVDDHLAIGDVIMVKVLTNDVETGKISLSMKEAAPQEENEYREEERAERPRYSQPYSGDGSTFEEKFKEWLKSSNERQAGLNKRNKRR